MCKWFFWFNYFWWQLLTDRVALPFCHTTLKTQKPLPSAYLRTFKNFGNHLRKKRLDLDLLQKEVAQKLGVCEPSVYNWENNLSKPAIKYIPKIIEFLGYVPFDISTKSVGEKMVAYRHFLVSKSTISCFF